MCSLLDHAASLSTLTLVLVLLGLQHASASSDKVAALMSCFASSCLSQKTTWQQFTADQPNCLTAAKIWWSPRPAKFAVTLVTQLSADRLPQVKAQCITWLGPLAAVLYLPLYNPEPALSAINAQKLQSSIQRIDGYVQALEQGQQGCQLRLMLMYELFAEEQAVVLYPVNSLRNYARLMADTDLVTNIDVDMIPSVSISTTLQDSAVMQTYADGCRAGKVYVFPAFETRCGGPSYADSVALMAKDKLPALLDEDCVGQMRGKVAPACHNATRFSHWLRTATAYQIDYQETFEPWFLSFRSTTKWFDPRYRGYGKNKIIQAAYMNHTGTQFNVYPDGFIIHRPHSESKARKQFLKAKFSKKGLQVLKGTVYEHIEALWQGSKAELAAGKYDPRVEESFKACVEKLPWWS